MIPGVNYVIYGCSSARTTPGVSLCWMIDPDRVIDDNLKRQNKNLALRTFRLFLLT